MNNITYAVSVDVNNPIIPYNVYVANVLDSNVRYLEITLYQNGNVITLSNEATATASLVTDDVLVDDSVACTISNNIITVPLEDLQRHGNLDVQVTVTEGEKVLAIPFPIQVRVTPNIAKEAQIDENSMGSYAEVVQEIAEARKGYDSLDERLNSDETSCEIVMNKVQSIGSQSQTGDNDKYPSVTAVRNYVNVRNDDLQDHIENELDGFDEAKADKADTNAQFERLIAVLQNKAGKAETLAGYGINDAYTKAEVTALNSAKVDKADYTEEVGDLKSAIANIGEDIERELFPNHLNIISEFDWELESGSINNSTGEEVDNGSCVRTGFIPLPESKTYRLSDKNDNTNYNVYYYDSNKEYLSNGYGSGAIKKSGAAYVRFTRVETYSAETTLLDFMKGFYGLRKDYEAGNYNDPTIYTSKYDVVESNRLASDTIIPQDVIEKELNAGKLTTILENKNVNLLDRTKLETGYGVDVEGNIKTTTGSVRLMRAMPIKPNTQYTFSLYGGWGVTNAWWLDRYAEDVISAVQGTTGSSLTVTSPSNAFFLRFSLANDENTQNVMIVEGGTLPGSFVGYDSTKLKLKEQYLPDSILPDDFDVVEANKLADQVDVGQETINELTKLSRLQNLIEDNSVNLFNRSKLETGYGVDKYGNIITNSVGGRVMRAMPILPNTEYTLSMFNSFGFLNPCWLDSHGETVISMISGTVGSPVTVTSPVNAYFLRFGFAPASMHHPGTDKAMIVKGDSLPSDFVDYVSGLMQIKRTLLPGAKGNKDWSGKKYIAFGDSRSCGYVSKTDGTVTWDDDESGKNNYPEMIGYYTGISVDNRAVPGGAFANRTAGGYYNLSFDYFTENLPTDADIITIFLGTNDRVIGSDPANLNPTEERDDQTNLFNAETFKGAIRNGLKKIRQKMPEVPIILMVDDRGFNATAADGGTTRADMIREVAREAGLPVFDIALKGMNQDTLNDEIYNGVKNKYWYHTDALHESILGNKMLAKALAGEMAKYLW